MVVKTREVALWLTLAVFVATHEQTKCCPSPDSILPCICTNRHEDIQIWCTHSDLLQVSKGIQKLGEFVKKPIDELIIENNYLPSLPGKVFQNVKILRLMLRHNGLERLSAGWLETQEKDLLEIFIVENDLRHIPSESLVKLQRVQAITIQSQNLKRIPAFTGMEKLRYINIQSGSLSAINEGTFKNLPSLERLFVRGSRDLRIIKVNAFYDLPRLRKLEITNCGVNQLHMRAFSMIPTLNELSLSDNMISDATMVGRAIRDLVTLSVLNLNHNLVDKLNEGAFVDQPMLETILLSNNKIHIIHHGAFHRVPKLRVVDLNYNKINQIHPESFMQQSGSGVEELYLIGNQIMFISEFRALLEALPRLKFLDLSGNLLQEIPRGALRGHPSLERLHLNKNSIKFIQADAFMAMPALRELHLSNNSLTDVNEGPYWNLPALKGLDLSYNYLKRLQPKLLYNLPALRRINLSHNQLTLVDPITFVETPLLEYVNMSGNALVSLHPATFRNLANLYEIDGSSNRLIEFVPGLPRGLEKLFIQRNQITSLPVTPSPDLDLPALRTLDISSNGIQKIPRGSMKTLHNLHRLYMSRNGLRQIDATSFGDLERLEFLDLSDNQILSVHPKSFTKLTHLKQVNLHGNTIEHFDFMAIQENAALHALDFSKNNLKSISPNLVNRALDVETLNISSNNLNELPVSLNMLSKLKLLDASFNNIKHFDGNSINNINTLKSIKMPHNRITELRTGSFKDLRNLDSIDLDSNNIEVIHPNAISNLQSLVSVHMGRNHIIDIPDHAFFNLPKLRIIELQGNRLQYISVRAFENIPLVQYLNLSNNQITNIDNSGLRQLSSVEVLDLSFNKLTTITRASFQYMEWLVELNLDNNLICYIGGQPFDFMARLKVLSLRQNKLASISEGTFAKLRSNIAIFDIDGNPLICNCAIIWLKSWLSESSSIGPKCADGTYVKVMPFSRADCPNISTLDDNYRSCLTHENEALLPNLTTSQVFSSLDKIKDYATQIKNNYQTNKINGRPSPEESDYFYDDYVDYPVNETVIEGMKTELGMGNNGSQGHLGGIPVLYAGTKNTTVKKPTVTPKPAGGSGFTFFGMPLPVMDVGKFLNTGRKMDWPVSKNAEGTKIYHVTETPKFETGGFSPMLPTTSGGFIPIPDPTVQMSESTFSQEGELKYNSQGSTEQVTMEISTKPTSNKVEQNTTNHKMKSEVHELEAFVGDDSSTHVAYNRTMNIEEQKVDPNNLSKYNLMESNVTITHVTEKEGLLITTDTTNDISQTWMETSTIPYSSSTVVPKPTSKKYHLESQPTALSAALVPKNAEAINHGKRPATITKVQMPHMEPNDHRDNFSPVSNREAKTRFSDSLSLGNTRIRHVDGKEWYYKNYNNTNLEPYVAPGVYSSAMLVISKLYLVCVGLFYQYLVV